MKTWKYFLKPTIKDHTIFKTSIKKPYENMKPTTSCRGHELPECPAWDSKQAAQPIRPGLWEPTLSARRLSPPGGTFLRSENHGKNPGIRKTIMNISDVYINIYIYISAYQYYIYLYIYIYKANKRKHSSSLLQWDFTVLSFSELLYSRVIVPWSKHGLWGMVIPQS